MSESLTPPKLGMTAWLTGLSGAGKTSIASVVHSDLLGRNISCHVLDADILRTSLNRDLGFARDDRIENVRRLARIAENLTRSGHVVLVACIAPYRRVRDEVRYKIGNYIEVHVNAPLKVCESRDPKGLYQLARRGHILNFTGIDDVYEEPASPELRCDTDKESLRESSSKVVFAIISFLNQIAE